MKLLPENRTLILSVLLLLLAVFVGSTTLADASSSSSRAIDADEAITLMYFVTDSSTSVVVITRNGVQTTSIIHVSQKELNQLIWDFHRQIEELPPSGQELTHYFATLEQANKLYTLLVAPIENAIEGAKQLVIVPSGVLFYLPFGTLYRCPNCGKRDLLSGQFLLERYSISYAPSLCYLGAAPKTRSGEGYRSILTVGSSPLYENEAKAIAALFPERSTLIGAAATPKNIEDLLQKGQYDVVHFTGGCFLLNRQIPLLSGIRLQQNEDGIFRISELLRVGASIDLLTFSTGLRLEPPMRSGDDEVASSAAKAFCSLTDAILASGVASAVIPLGNVDPSSTKYLMEVMYQKLRHGATKAEALRAAQLTILNNPHYRDPYHWAQFALYGDWGGGETMKKPPDTGKLDYALYLKLQEWKTSDHTSGQAPKISVVVTLTHPVTPEDLEALRALSDELKIQGAFGSFVQLRLPLTLLDAVCALPEVRSVAPPAATISN